MKNRFAAVIAIVAAIWALSSCASTTYKNINYLQDIQSDTTWATVVNNGIVIKPKDQLSIGDLIYNDTNNDGNVDTNDRVIIGSTQPKLRYSLNLGLEWKNLDFQVTAMGLYGCDYNLQGNGYFTRGNGDENLSAFVRDGLISGEYPSLSYYQSTNNFIASSFWLRDRSYFKIQNVEIGYNFNFKKDAAVKGLRLALKGNNLGTFSSLPYIDAVLYWL